MSRSVLPPGAKQSPSRRRTPDGDDAAPSRAVLAARKIAEEIIAGNYPVGSELPGEAEVAAEHGVSRAAIGEALWRLEALGLVQRVRGQPARVAAADICAQYDITAVVAQPAEGGYAGPTWVVLDRQRRVQADAELSTLLGATEGTSWLSVSGLRLVAEISTGPLSCVNAWLATRAERVTDRPEMTRAWIEEQVGAAIVEVTEHVTASVLSPLQGRTLQTRGGMPCLQVMRRYLRRGGVIAAVVRDTHPADRIAVSVRLRGADAKPAAPLRKAAAPG